MATEANSFAEEVRLFMGVDGKLYVMPMNRDKLVIVPLVADGNGGVVADMGKKYEEEGVE